MKKTLPLITLNGYSLNLKKATLASSGCKIQIATKCKKDVAQSRQLVKQVTLSEKPAYGLNTGFGYLAKERISITKLKKLQHNILKSHAGGWGDAFSEEETRLLMVLKLNLLIKGYSGVRYEICDFLQQLINNEVYPVIPEYGSVGASGDLLPLAHLGLILIGEGKVSFNDKIISAKSALNRIKLSPLQLAEKEGLSFVNGTEAMQAIGGLALAHGLDLFHLANKACALSFEALEGIPSIFDSRLHKVRGQLGQIEVAKEIKKLLKTSSIFKTRKSNPRIQDPYSLRCTPQVHGASLDSLLYCKNIIERELNGVTDNPIVFAESKEIISGGNFHGEPLAMAFDFAAIALSELSNISERRLELLCNPYYSQLPPFLTANPGEESGYMALQYLSASLVNENKLLANPACTDSIPGNVGIEDFVSMGMTSARKLKKIVNNLKIVLICELLAASQAIYLRQHTKLGEGTKKLYHKIRRSVPPLTEDRIVAEDVKKLELVISTL